MKALLALLTIQGYLAVLAAAAATTFISNAKPVSSVNTIQTQLAFANGSVYFGNVKYSTYSEPLILAYPGGAPGKTGGTSFTSFHSAQTGWQTLYVYPHDVKPIGFTVPHSGFIPPGVDAYNFTVSTSGDKLFRYKNFNRWYACTTPTTPAGTYEVFYVGEGKSVPHGCIRIDISTYGYGNCN